MTKDTILDQITEIFREIFADNRIVLTSKTSVMEIDGWDSLAQISLMVAIETRLGIKFSSDEIEKLTIVGDIIDCIAKCPFRNL
jgi:acyl carrier protein